MLFVPMPNFLGLILLAVLKLLTIAKKITPTRQDFNSAIRSILRLQDVYHLSERDLNGGIIEGSTPLGVELNWYDCIKMADNAIDQKNYYRAYNWALQAVHDWNKIISYTPSKQVRIRILKPLAISSFQVDAGLLPFI